MSSATVTTSTWSAWGGVYELIVTNGTDEGVAMVVEELAKVTTPDRAAEIASALRAAYESQPLGDLDKARADLREVLGAADQRNNAARAARN